MSKEGTARRRSSCLIILAVDQWSWVVSGHLALTLRERHKYTLRQGPLDRIEQEEDEGAVRERSRVDVLQGGRQRF